MQDDLKKYTALQALSNSEGGKILMDACLKDISSCIDSIAYSSGVQTLETYIQLACTIKEKLGLYRTLKNAEENVNLTKIAIEESLKTQE